jgi:hypothetical protein
MSLNAIQAKYERKAIAAGCNHVSYYVDPKAAYDSKDPLRYYRRDRDERMARDQATAANSAPAPYGRLAAQLHKVAKDYHDGEQKLSKEHISHLFKLLNLLAQSDNPPEEEAPEEEVAEETVDQAGGPEDLPYGGRPNRGSAEPTPLKRDNPISQDKGMKGMTSGLMSCDENIQLALDAAAHIKVQPSSNYVPPRRRHEDSYAMDEAESDSFDKMFPEVSRIRHAY